MHLHKVVRVNVRGQVTRRRTRIWNFELNGLLSLFPAGLLSKTMLSSGHNFMDLLVESAWRGGRGLNLLVKLEARLIERNAAPVGNFHLNGNVLVGHKAPLR